MRDGKCFIGADAWAHMESKAGRTMATFLERCIRPPLAEMAKREEVWPEAIRLSWDDEAIRIEGEHASIYISRRREEAGASADEMP